MSCLRVWLGGLPVGLVDSIGLLVELGVELNMGGVLTLVECSTPSSTWGQICSTGGLVETDANSTGYPKIVG